MTTIPEDIIDHLVGITPGSKGEQLRARRPVTRTEAQASYRALFEPSDVSHITLAERFTVATFVAKLHRDADIAAFYGDRLAALENGATLLGALETASADATASGPYGHYPAGPLSTENTAGTEFQLAKAESDALGLRLKAALEHAHLLVFHPRDARPDDLARLVSAGWSTTGIVTLSQLIAFLSFQIRIVTGLKVLTAA
jgi:CMD domain protein